MKIINIDDSVGYWGVSAQWLRNRLPADKDEAVTIRLNTPGGDVFEGFKIYQLLSDYTNITVELGALVASAGTYMILSAKNIIARETSTMMIHKAWSFAWGNADEIKKEMDLLIGIDTMIAKVYAKRLKTSQKKMLTAMSDETWLFGGQAIKDFGIADDVIVEDSEEIDETTVKATVNAALKNYKNELYMLKMGEKPPDNKRMSNSIKKEEPELSKDKKTQTDENQSPVITETDVQNAVMAERSRMNQILNVAGLAITDEVAKALNNGQSYPEFCVALAEARRSEPETSVNQVPVNNVAAIGNITSAPEARETVVAATPEDKIQAELDEMYKVNEVQNV